MKTDRIFTASYLPLDQETKKIKYCNVLYDSSSILIENCLVEYFSIVEDSIDNGKKRYYFKVLEDDERFVDKFIVFERRLKQVNKLIVAINAKRVKFGDKIILDGIITPNYSSSVNNFNLSRFLKFKQYNTIE